MKYALMLLVAELAFGKEKLSKPNPDAKKYRIFVGESESFVASGFGLANKGVAGAIASSSASTEKMTVLAMKAFHEKCLKVTVVNTPKDADYFVRLDRNGIFIRVNALAVFNRAGEIVFVGRGLSLQREAKGFCKLLQ